MSTTYKDRVLVTSNTAGTGTLALGVAVAGYQSFVEASITDGAQISYLISDGVSFEIGLGTYTALTESLSRDTVRLSKMPGIVGTSRITCSGRQRVSIVQHATDIVQGPASAVVDNALVRWDGTSGRLLKSSALIVSDGGAISGVQGAGTLSRTNDTNVTLSLGGTVAGSIFNDVSLTLGWSGQLGTTRGGTALSSYALGDLLYASATDTLAKLAGNTTTTRKFLRQTGAGLGVSAAPAWDTILAADIGGTLGVANGGTGLATLATNRIPYGNGTSALQSSASLTFDGSTLTVAGGVNPLRLSNAPSATNNTQLRFYGDASAADLWAIGTDISAGTSQTYFQIYGLAGGGVVLTATQAGYTGLGTATPQGLFHAVAAANDSLLIRGHVALSDGASIFAVNSANNATKGLEFGGSKFLFTGGYLGVGVSPLNPLDAVVPTQAYTDATAGVGGFRIATGAGANTAEALIAGVHDGDYAWLQAIKPGTANRTLALNPNGGNVSVGASLSLSTAAQTLSMLPVGNAATTLASFDVRGSAVSNTTREFLAHFGMTSSTGSGATGDNKHKVALYAGIVANSGSGDVWSGNNVTQLNTGFNLNAHGWEFDINNDSGTDRYGVTSANLATAIYGVAITGASANVKTAALHISEVNPAKWSTGILISQSMLHYGIDFHFMATASQIRFRNNCSIVWRNAGDTADLVALTGDSSNMLNIGSSFATVFTNANFTVNGILSATNYISTAHINSAAANLVLDTGSNAYDVVLGGNYLVAKAGGAVGIGTTTPAVEAAIAKLAVVDTADVGASSLATSNTKAVAFFRGKAASGYGLAIGAESTGALPYLQGVVQNGGGGAAALLLNAWGGAVIVGAIATDVISNNANAWSFEAGIARGNVASSAALQLGRSGSDGTLAAFFKGTSAVGSISITTTTTTYNTTSDARLKEDPQPVANSGQIIDDLRVYDFRWKVNGSRSIGVFAQEAFEVYPDMITRPDTPEGTWAADYSKLVPVLTAEVKSLRARLASLQSANDNFEARLAALEAA